MLDEHVYDAACRQEIQEIAVAILRRADHVLVRRRPASDPLLGGLLEFPGGRIERGETPVRAAGRELAEEAGVADATLRLLHIEEHAYADRNLRLFFFLGEICDPMTVAGDGWEWVGVEALTDDRVPAANQTVARILRSFAGAARLK